MRLPVRALIVLLLAGAPLAGCGSDDVAQTNAYVAKVNAAQDQFVRDAGRAQEAITTATSTPAQDRKALDRFAQAVRRTVADLRGIQPPTAVAPLHAGLVAALAAYEPVIAAQRQAAGSSDPRVLISARTRFSTAAQAVNDRVQRAITRINAKLSG